MRPSAPHARVTQSGRGYAQEKHGPNEPPRVGRRCLFMEIHPDFFRRPPAGTRSRSPADACASPRRGASTARSTAPCTTSGISTTFPTTRWWRPGKTAKSWWTTGMASGANGSRRRLSRRSCATPKPSYPRGWRRSPGIRELYARRRSMRAPSRVRRRLDFPTSWNSAGDSLVALRGLAVVARRTSRGTAQWLAIVRVVACRSTAVGS